MRLLQWMWIVSAILAVQLLPFASAKLGRGKSCNVKKTECMDGLTCRGDHNSFLSLFNDGLCILEIAVCKYDEDCEAVDRSYCTEHGYCDCQMNYKYKEGKCVSVLTKKKVDAWSKKFKPGVRCYYKEGKAIQGKANIGQRKPNIAVCGSYVSCTPGEIIGFWENHQCEDGQYFRKGKCEDDSDGICGEPRLDDDCNHHSQKHDEYPKYLMTCQKSNDSKSLTGMTFQIKTTYMVKDECRADKGDFDCKLNEHCVAGNLDTGNKCEEFECKVCKGGTGCKYAKNRLNSQHTRHCICKQGFIEFRIFNECIKVCTNDTDCEADGGGFCSTVVSGNNYCSCKFPKADKDKIFPECDECATDQDCRATNGRPMCVKGKCEGFSNITCDETEMGRLRYFKFLKGSWVPDTHFPSPDTTHYSWCLKDDDGSNYRVSYKCPNKRHEVQDGTCNGGCAPNQPICGWKCTSENNMRCDNGFCNCQRGFQFQFRNGDGKDNKLFGNHLGYGSCLENEQCAADLECASGKECDESHQCKCKVEEINGHCPKECPGGDNDCPAGHRCHVDGETNVCIIGGRDCTKDNPCEGKNEQCLPVAGPGGPSSPAPTPNSSPSTTSDGKTPSSTPIPTTPKSVSSTAPNAEGGPVGLTGGQDVDSNSTIDYNDQPSSNLSTSTISSLVAKDPPMLCQCIKGMKRNADGICKDLDADVFCKDKDWTIPHKHPDPAFKRAYAWCLGTKENPAPAKYTCPPGTTFKEHCCINSDNKCDWSEDLVAACLNCLNLKTDTTGTLPAVHPNPRLTAKKYLDCTFENGNLMGVKNCLKDDKTCLVVV